MVIFWFNTNAVSKCFNCLFVSILGKLNQLTFTKYCTNNYNSDKIGDWSLENLFFKAPKMNEEIIQPETINKEIYKWHISKKINTDT